VESSHEREQTTRLAAIVKNEDFSVLKRRHGASVHIDVRVWSGAEAAEVAGREQTQQASGSKHCAAEGVPIFMQETR